MEYADGTLDRIWKYDLALRVMEEFIQGQPEHPDGGFAQHMTVYDVCQAVWDKWRIEVSPGHVRNLVRESGWEPCEVVKL